MLQTKPFQSEVKGSGLWVMSQCGSDHGGSTGVPQCAKRRSKGFSETQAGLNSDNQRQCLQIRCHLRWMVVCCQPPRCRRACHCQCFACLCVCVCVQPHHTPPYYLGVALWRGRHNRWNPGRGLCHFASAWRQGSHCPLAMIKTSRQMDHENGNQLGRQKGPYISPSSFKWSSLHVHLCKNGNVLRAEAKKKIVFSLIFFSNFF